MKLSIVERLQGYYVIHAGKPVFSNKLPVHKAADLHEAATTITELVSALEVFVREFEERREAYIRRYRSNPGIGANNFDSMPDEWPMEGSTFTMGDFRRAVTALSNTRGDKNEQE